MSNETDLRKLIERLEKAGQGNSKTANEARQLLMAAHARDRGDMYTFNAIMKSIDGGNNGSR